MNYLLGPLKCSGKRKSYPSEIELLKKQENEKNFKDVINRAKMNENGLKVLDQQLRFEAKNITSQFQADINQMTLLLNEESQRWKQQINLLENEMRTVQQQNIELTNQNLRMNSSITYHNNENTKQTNLLSAKLEVLGQKQQFEIQKIISKFQDDLNHMTQVLTVDLQKLKPQISLIENKIDTFKEQQIELTNHVLRLNATVDFQTNETTKLMNNMSSELEALQQKQMEIITVQLPFKIVQWDSGDC